MYEGQNALLRTCSVLSGHQQRMRETWCMRWGSCFTAASEVVRHTDYMRPLIIVCGTKLEGFKR